MGMTIEIDILDHFDEDELVDYLRENDWECEKKGVFGKSYDINNYKPLDSGVKVNYGLGLKDESLAKAIEDAFDKHGYFLIEKLAQIC